MCALDGRWCVVIASSMRARSDCNALRCASAHQRTHAPTGGARRRERPPTRVDRDDDRRREGNDPAERDPYSKRHTASARPPRANGHGGYEHHRDAPREERDRSDRNGDRHAGRDRDRYERPRGESSGRQLQRDLRPAPPRAPKFSFDADGGGDHVEGARVLGGDQKGAGMMSFAHPTGRGGSGAHNGSSFDKVAPLPEPVHAASARSSGAPMPTRKRVEFATPSGASAASTVTRIAADSPANASDPGATPAGGVGSGGSALASTTWARGAERDAKKRQAREPSPDLASIDAANAADFDERMAGEIAAEGLQLERDWYLREEEGGMDGDEGQGALGDEETYTRNKSAGAAAPVRSMCCDLRIGINSQFNSQHDALNNESETNTLHSSVLMRMSACAHDSLASHSAQQGTGTQTVITSRRSCVTAAAG